MPGARERLVLATKCGIRPPWDGAQHCYDSSHSHIVSSVEDSLRRMGVDYVDLLMIHRPDDLGDPTEIVEAFGQLHDQGKVRWFGVSNYCPSQVLALQGAMNVPSSMWLQSAHASKAPSQSRSPRCATPALRRKSSPARRRPALPRNAWPTRSEADAGAIDTASKARPRLALPGVARPVLGCRPSSPATHHRY